MFALRQSATALDDPHALPPLSDLGCVGAGDLDVGSGGNIEHLELGLSLSRGWRLEAADGDGLRVDRDERRRRPRGLGHQKSLLSRISLT